MASGSLLPIDVGERFSGFVGIGKTGNVAWVSGQYTHDGFSFPAESGVQWINLAGISGTTTGVATRPIATTAGATYTLTFGVGNVVDPAGRFGTSSTVDVYQDTTLLGSFTNTTGGTTLTWQRATFHFTAAGAYTTLRFINGDPPGDLVCGLDDIVLTADAGDHTDEMAHRAVASSQPPANSGAPHAAAPQTVYDFLAKDDGATPRDGLAIDAAGHLFGVTSVSGAGNGGVLYEVTPGNGGGPGSEQTLYSFGEASGTLPNGVPVFDNAGALYGTSRFDGPGGAGTVWQLTPQVGGWSFSVLYSFTGGEDGGNPASGVIVGDDGAIYGTTQRGGANQAGVAYRLVPDQDGGWTEQVMHAFSSADGAYPIAALVEGANGVFYGTTSEAGPGGAGTVFSLTRDVDGIDWDIDTLWSFTGGADGGNPSGSPILDAGGSLYGTAQFGGLPKACPDGEWYWYGVPPQPGDDFHHGCGIVYRLDPVDGGGAWSETVLWNFTGGNDGSLPNARLTMGGDGTLYSTTPVGGTQDEGKLFALKHTNGKWGLTTLTTLEASSARGFLPRSGVTLAPDGTIYAAASVGGSTWVHVKNYGYGTIFSLHH